MRLLALCGGALPGVFALGMLTRRANSFGVIVGAVASIGVTLRVQNFTAASAFFHAFVVLGTSMLVGYLASFCRPSGADLRRLQGLTVWDRAPSPAAR